jgi:Haem-binding domain
MANIDLNRRLHWRDTAAGGCATLLLMAIAACSSTNTQYSAPAVGSGLTTDPRVREMLVYSCFDCHSNQRPAAWSARLAPSYLFGVDQARQVLNFSEWPAYPAQRKRAELEAVAKVVADRSMPPGDYDFVHPGARLTAEQRQLLLGWASSAAVPAH